MAYNRDNEKDQEIGQEFLNPDKDMDNAASKIQGHFRRRQKRRDKRHEKRKEKIKTQKKLEGGYDREAEKNQEIGQEFLNPDADMDIAASKIQGHFRRRQKRKAKRNDQVKKGKYSRLNEKNQEIGEEFLNPDKEMDSAALKIQIHFRKKQERKLNKGKKKKKKKKSKGKKPKKNKKKKKIKKVPEVVYLNSSMPFKQNSSVQYLKRRDIGEVVAEACAQVYINKPAYPIDYIAKWMLNYCKTQENLQKQADEYQREQAIKMKQRKQQEELKRREEERLEALAVIQAKTDAMKSKIQASLYQKELLFPITNFLNRKFGLTGTYIATYDHPLLFEDFDENDDDLDAHRDMEQPKVLTYIAYNNNHKFIHKQVLPEESQTYSLFQDLVEDDQIPVNYDSAPDGEEEDMEEEEAEEGEEGEEKSSYRPSLYIDDIIRNEVHYFRIPKLGSYISSCLVYENCLEDAEAFEQALKNTLKVTKQRRKLEEKKQGEKEDYLQRREELVDDLENQVKLQKLDDDWNKKEWESYDFDTFLFKKKYYAVCADTLGQDRKLTNEEQKEFERFVRYFSKCWTDRQKNQLQVTIDRHMEYLDNLPESLPRDDDRNILWKDYLSSYKEAENVVIDERYTDIKNGTEEEEGHDLKKEMSEEEFKYWQDCIRLECQRKAFQAEDMKKQFAVLQDYQVIIHRTIFIHLLFFLGYTKSDIYKTNTNHLDWKKTKKLLNDEKLFNKIKEYVHQGPKPGEIKPYAHIAYIKEKFDKIKQQDIDKYNIGLGRIFQWFKTVMQVRLQDIQLRKAQRQQKRASRTSLIEEHDNWQQEKTQLLEKKKEDFRFKQEELAQELKDKQDDEGEDAKVSQVEKVIFNEQEHLDVWLESNPEPVDQGTGTYPPAEIESDEDNDQ